MKKEDQILRNWKIVWTTIAIILSILTVIKVTPIVWGMLDMGTTIEIYEDRFDTTIKISYSDLMFLGFGVVLTSLINGAILFFIWRTRSWILTGKFIDDE